jgi:hypothetical protein
MLPAYLGGGHIDVDIASERPNKDGGKARLENALLKEYGEVAANFRTLTDIRFRMLGFLPLATGAAVLGAAVKDGLAGITTLLMALFGLATTVGLAIYNARNDQLYDELLGRAAEIERLLGIPDGSFANRPRSWLTFKVAGYPLQVGHRDAVAAIYATSAALWFSLILLATLGLLSRPSSDALPIGLRQVIAILAAVGLTACGVAWIARLHQKRDTELRDLAFHAYESVVKELAPTASSPLVEQRVLELCKRLAEAPAEDELIGWCVRLGSDTKKSKGTIKDSTKKNSALERVRARARFYAKNEGSLQLYLSMESKQSATATLLASLTDLPPRWIRDSGEDRRGAVAAVRAKTWPVTLSISTALFVLVILFIVAAPP